VAVGATVVSGGRAWGSTILRRGNGSVGDVPARAARGASRKNRGEQKNKKQGRCMCVVGREERE